MHPERSTCRRSLLPYSLRRVTLRVAILLPWEEKGGKLLLRTAGDLGRKRRACRAWARRADECVACATVAREGRGKPGEGLWAAADEGWQRWRLGEVGEQISSWLRTRCSVERQSFGSFISVNVGTALTYGTNTTTTHGMHQSSPQTKQLEEYVLRSTENHHQVNS
jgi:hypothetical protein